MNENYKAALILGLEVYTINELKSRVQAVKFNGDYDTYRGFRAALNVRTGK